MAYVINDSCVACGTCIDECPVGAISEGDIYAIDPETCTDCGTCADVCPQNFQQINVGVTPHHYQQTGHSAMKSSLKI